jgi:RNA polymerase sigma-70 factor (ECF subfamily)
MDVDPIAEPALTTRAFNDVWHDDRGYLLGLATRMLGDRAEAEDVIQEAFGRLALVEIDEIEDVRGWMAVVVRRMCLDRLRSAHHRRESVADGEFPEGARPLQGDGTTDPADRVTLDDQVQQALSIVLDRLSPAERTAFVLHDVFGFAFDAVGEIVGRTPTACRQLASRARRSLRTDADETLTADLDVTGPRLLSERFIAACAGGDISELMELLDPEIAGDATLVGHGPLVTVRGRPEVAQRLLGLFGPSTDTMLLPFAIEGTAAFIALAHGRLAAVSRLDVEDGVIHHIASFVFPPG